jgi:tetratricopeptide (TPR) repeat protein
VVLQVPARAKSDPIAMLEQRYSRGPRDEATAAELAERYVERARAKREPRYFARAEALVQPWAMRASARVATLRVQADILQNRHEFDSAVKLLDRAIARAPQDAGARLMRASIRLVQGRALEARADCAAVLAGGESAAGTICVAQVLGATGNLARAESLLKQLLRREFPLPDASDGRRQASLRVWALEVLADFADRAGDVAAAEIVLREVVAAEPENEAARSALSDLLLARGAYREALAVVNVPAPSIGLLARRAVAQRFLRDPSLATTRDRIDAALALSARRGDRPHLREEALIALDLDGDATRALDIARQNFGTQRETLDARLLARAAHASASRAALLELIQWINATGYEDRALADLQRVGAGRKPRADEERT